MIWLLFKFPFSRFFFGQFKRLERQNLGLVKSEHFKNKHLRIPDMEN
jgi:hypothetical protein